VSRVSIASLEIARPELERLIDTAYECCRRSWQDDADAREQCATLLRQADGVLRMLELHDAAQLARDMGLTLGEERIAPGHENLLEAAFQVLMRYPAYVCTRREPRPELLRPEHDALRMAGRLEPLSDASFLPALGLPGCHCPAREPSAQPDAELPRRLRHLYQLGLLAVVRGRFDPVHVHMMRRASDRMLELAGGSEAGERWWLLGGVLEGFANGALRATPERIRVLRTGDGWLRAWTRDPTQRGAALHPEQRSVLLSLVTRIDGGQRVDEIRSLAHLVSILPDDATLARERRRLLGVPDDDAAATIAAVHEEFRRVRRALDATTPGSGAGTEVLAEVNAALQRAVQALTAGGLAEVATRLELQSVQIEHCIGTGVEASVEELQRMADAVVEAEVALDDFARARGIGNASVAAAFTGDTLAQARSMTLAQIREHLESAKRELAAVVDAGGADRPPASVRQGFEQVRGALRMLAEPDVASIAERACDLLGEPAAGLGAHDAATGEHLADVLIALEYCIASLQAGDVPDRRILELARVPSLHRDHAAPIAVAGGGMC
jgi:hypothetical protein